jgi:tetratricopeptide (TPR) repeat protein
MDVKLAKITVQRVQPDSSGHSGKHMSDSQSSGGSGAPASLLSADEQPPQNPAKKPPVGATVEWDHKGRVVRSRFSNGHVCQFRYDQQGSLYAFTYARLAWSTTDGARWTAVDQENTYTLDGTVEICVDGTIRIERLDICRRLRLNGGITDQLSDGSTVETPRVGNDLTPADLLANARQKTSEAARYSSMEKAAIAAAMQAHVGVGPNSDSMKAWQGEPVHVAGPERRAAQPTDLPVSHQRKFIAQGVRFNRMRNADSGATQAAPPSATLRNRWKRWLANSTIKFLQIVKGPEHVAIASSVDALAFLAHAERRVDEARMLHEHSLQIRRRALGPFHSDIGISLYGLAKIYDDWGRFGEAETYYLRAIKMFDDGFKKARFLHSAEAVSPQYVAHSLGRLVTGLHGLCGLYYGQKHRHLCEQLHAAALNACQSVSIEYPAEIDDTVKSIATMAMQLEVRTTKPDSSLRISRWERHSTV